MPYVAFGFLFFSLAIAKSEPNPAIRPNRIRPKVPVMPTKSKATAVDIAAKPAVISEPANSL